MSSALASLPLLLALLVGCDSDPEGEGPVPRGDASSVAGATYEELAASWWSWTYSLPADDHPALDPDGSDCARGQTGDVFFLAGTFGENVTRRCAMPAGRPVFFPILNVEVNNVGEETPLSGEELLERARGLIDGVDTLALEVDGTSYTEAELRELRTGTIASFELTDEHPNLFDLFGVPDLDGTIEPSASDGFYVLLPPFEPGEHTVRFSGSVGGSTPEPEDDFNLALDYTLLVE